MQPVLNHLKPRLSDDAHPLLTALLAAPGDPEHIAQLDEIPAWREPTPQPLE